MKQDMPTGIPFYMEKQSNGLFTHTLATDRKDFSFVSLDCFHWMLYNFAEFEGPNKTFYPMQTVVTGERIVEVGTKKYRVDCCISTPDKDYFIEFYGCRYPRGIFFIF